LYAVHFVNLSVFGSPSRAPAIQASLILSASAACRGPPPSLSPGALMRARLAG
jgi:hypothetical protein